MKSLKTILWICGGSYVSGAELVAVNIIRRLSFEGVRTIVISNAWNNGDFENRLSEIDNVLHFKLWIGSISLKVTKIHWTINALIRLPAARIKFRSILKQYRPEKIIYNGFTLIMLLGLGAKTKNYVYFHEFHDRSFKQRHFLKSFRNRITFISISDFITNKLSNSGIETDKIITIKNGIEIPDKQSQKVNHKIITFAIVGQVAPWKGHEVLLDSICHLKKNLGHQDFSDFKCLIIGDGDKSYKRVLSTLIHKLGLQDDIVWTGYLEDQAQIYTGIDFIVVPTIKEEPFGLVVVEAAVREIPAIASDCGGLKEIIVDQHTGLLIPRNDPVRLSNAIHKMLTDNVIRKKMGENARIHAELYFSMSRQLREFKSKVISA